MIIDLNEWEWVHALNVGNMRFTANWGKKDAAHYDKKRMEDDRTAQQRACVCELAVAKGTNRYWSGSVWPKTKHDWFKRRIADVGYNIEVRCVRTQTAAAVREYQLGQGLHLFVARTTTSELTQAEILGHLDYDQAWELGETPHYIDPTTESEGSRTRVVSVEHLTKWEPKQTVQ